MDNTTSTTRFGSGQPVRRIEDDKLLQGQGRFTDDITDDASYTGLLRVCFVRSPYPHARIVSADLAAARGMPGVVAVYDGAALVAAGVKPMPSGAGIGFKRFDGTPFASPERHILAHERVRFVGEAVAVVVAQTLQQARDAAEAVLVEYEELAMVVGLDAAVAPGAATLCDGAPDNVACETRYGSIPAADAAFAGAAHVVSLALTNQRLAALTLEPRALLAGRCLGIAEPVRIGDVRGYEQHRAVAVSDECEVHEQSVARAVDVREETAALIARFAVAFEPHRGAGG